MDMPAIGGLWVSIDGKEVLKMLNLRIQSGETHIHMIFAEVSNSRFFK